MMNIWEIMNIRSLKMSRDELEKEKTIDIDFHGLGETKSRGLDLARLCNCRKGVHILTTSDKCDLCGKEFFIGITGDKSSIKIISNQSENFEFRRVEENE